MFAKEHFTKRHDKMSAQLHFSIWEETGVKLDKELWFE
jgi:hypothetical protein